MLTMAVPQYNEETSNCKINNDCKDIANNRYGGDF